MANTQPGRRSPTVWEVVLATALVISICASWYLGSGRIDENGQESSTVPADNPTTGQRGGWTREEAEAAGKLASKQFVAGETFDITGDDSGTYLSGLGWKGTLRLKFTYVGVFDRSEYQRAGFAQSQAIWTPRMHDGDRLVVVEADIHNVDAVPTYRPSDNEAGNPLFLANAFSLESDMELASEILYLSCDPADAYRGNTRAGYGSAYDVSPGNSVKLRIGYWYNNTDVNANPELSIRLGPDGNAQGSCVVDLGKMIVE